MSDPAGPGAREFLVAAYPDERRRAAAERWLGLLARQAAAGDGQVRWWTIPALAPAAVVLNVRWAVLGVAAAAVIGWGAAAGIGHRTDSAVWYLITLVVAGLVTSNVVKRRGRRPRVLRPRPPRTARLPGATAGGSYRSARATRLRIGLAVAPAGALFGLLAGWGTATARRGRLCPGRSRRPTPPPRSSRCLPGLSRRAPPSCRPRSARPAPPTRSPTPSRSTRRCSARRPKTRSTAPSTWSTRPGTRSRTAARAPAARYRAAAVSRATSRKNRTKSARSSREDASRCPRVRGGGPVS